jgi:adenine-specific DNA-methyltransferase
MSNYNQLKDVLNDIFELNKADLDFGIYRIMNQKRKQVNEFIEKQLPEDIKKALSDTQSSDKTEIQNELKTLKKNLDDAGIVAEDTPKYKSLHERLKTIENSDSLEQEVFSHLANFFRRYYKDGDFISMRRYKKDVYAIPYEGEEVKLHWANHDQYYIKSTENFKNYTFKTGDGKLVHFQLKEVSTEQNNNKLQGDDERRFAIYSALPVEENGEELLINFIYEPVSKATKQETLINEAIDILSAKVPITFASVFALSPTEKNSKRTLLEKHLSEFVSKNSFDYFIHKDLGGFLNRELDFYIKNEVLYLDDVNTKQTEFFVAQLSKVKAIKAVSQKIIEFLAQIENFQKKLWLKKKFVTSTDYCITLDKVPAEYYPEIIKNNGQLLEWKLLFDVDIKSVEELTFEQYLVLDTKFFDSTFKDRLLAEFDYLDEVTNGLMINSDNFHALELLSEKYSKSIKTTYLDPPYNTEKDRAEGKFLYKDGFSHSSWCSMIIDRYESLRRLMKIDGVCFTSIDDAEVHVLKSLLTQIFGEDNFIGQWNWFKSATPPNLSKKIKKNIEYILVFESENNEQKFIGIQKESKSDDPFTKPQNTIKELSFPIGSINFNYTDKIIESGIYGTDKFPNELLNTITFKDGKNSEIAIFRNRFIWTQEKLNEEILNGTIINLSKNGVLSYKKANYDPEVPPNFIDKNVNVGTTEQAGNDLFDIFNSKIFDYPKPPSLIEYLCNFCSDKNDTILDFFAGSGTTGHAIIKLNRKDSGNRKFILVEMGSYFNSVTKPRIQKVIYSDNWKNGTPQDKAGISQIIKYQVLESYEDTLNNLFLQSNIELDFIGKAKDEYLMQYMLELESRDHLFNLEIFRKPFDYELRVTENNELKPTKIDLVETFNYLIGLYVNKVQRVKDIKVVEGTTRTGIKTLVIWRDLETTTHDEVEKLLRRFYDSQRTKEFEQIYINGDHHLENLRSEGDQFKIKLIEETFFKKMFNEIEL